MRLFNRKKTVKNYNEEVSSIVADISRSLEHLRDVNGQLSAQMDSNLLTIAALQEENVGLQKVLMNNNKITEQIQGVIM